jgi:RIO-like serine/threonine protein kinase
MRDFEKDFDFDSEYFGVVVKIQRFRIDKYRTVTKDPNRVGDSEHDNRIAAHIERVQRELQELGKIKGGRG